MQGAPRRMAPSAMPYAMAGALVPAQQFGFYDPYGAYAPMFRAGRFPGRGFPMPARGGFPYPGRGYGPPLDRPPPPGTPGVSSGYQVTTIPRHPRTSLAHCDNTYCHNVTIHLSDQIRAIECCHPAEECTLGFSRLWEGRTSVPVPLFHK